MHMIRAPDHMHGRAGPTQQPRCSWACAGSPPPPLAPLPPRSRAPPATPSAGRPPAVPGGGKGCAWTVQPAYPPRPPPPAPTRRTVAVPLRGAGGGMGGGGGELRMRSRVGRGAGRQKSSALGGAGRCRNIGGAPGRKILSQFSRRGSAVVTETGSGSAAASVPSRRRVTAINAVAVSRSRAPPPAGGGPLWRRAQGRACRTVHAPPPAGGGPLGGAAGASGARGGAEGLAQP
jgi:hypothetical protein